MSTTINQAAAKLLQANATVLADSQNALLEHIFEGGGGDPAAFLPAWELDDIIGTLVVPEGVTRLGTYAFAYRGVSSVTLPSTLTELGAAPFASGNISNGQFGGYFNHTSSSLKTVVFASDSHLRVIGNSALVGTTMDEMIIPEGVTTIEDFALSKGNNSSSTAVFVLPESLESISFAAFANYYSDMDHEDFESSVFEITFTGKTIAWVERYFGIPKFVYDEASGSFVANSYYYMLAGGSVIHCTDGDLTVE